MNETTIITFIDAELFKLQQARALLSGIKPGQHVTKPSTSPAPRAKRTMSAEGRARIAAAQRKRWAAQKKAAK